MDEKVESLSSDDLDIDALEQRLELFEGPPGPMYYCLANA